MKYECDGCEFSTDNEETFECLADVRRLIERINSGDIVPDGGCPKCGGLVYRTKQPPAELIDGKEFIDADWLSEWTKKEAHVWAILDSNLAICYNQSGLLNGIWTIFETLDNGDEISHCHVVTRGECRRMVDLLTS